MRFTRVIVTAVITVVVLFFGALWLMPYLVNAPVDTGRLVHGLQQFARDNTAAGKPLPSEVSLSELIAQGYVSSNDVRGFHGADVRFSLKADASKPGSLMVEVRTPEGSTLLQLSDGSAIQQPPLLSFPTNR